MCTMIRRIGILASCPWGLAIAHCYTSTLIVLSHNDREAVALIILEENEVSGPNDLPRRSFVTCALYYNDTRKGQTVLPF